MSGAPKTADYEEDVDYIDEEEDDEEDDFVPGVEPDDEDDDADDVVPLLHGSLFVDESKSLHYQGDGFHLSSSDPPQWNVVDGGEVQDRKAGESFEVIMTGPCDFESATAKAPPVKLKVTFTLIPSSEVNTVAGALPISHSREVSTADTNGSLLSSQLKKAPSEDDDEKVKATKSPGDSDGKVSGLAYRVFGQQIDTHGGDVMEFKGAFYPSKQNEEQVTLVCQVRIVASMPGPAPAAVAVAASAATARIDKFDDDEDDDDEEYEEDVDYDELIALHEDANLSVDMLQKRYRGSQSEEKLPAKRTKKPPPKPPSDNGDEDDDDDDYGF